MKYLALLFGLFALLNGCKDKLDKSCDANFLQADVNGLLWEAQEVTAFKAMGQGGNLTVQAKSAAGEVRELSIQMPNDVTPGTYQLRMDVFTHSIIVYPGAFFPESGELVITVHDTATGVLKGTFAFALPSENLSVQEGSFCVQY